MKQFINNFASIFLIFILLLCGFLYVFLAQNGAVLAESPPDIGWLQQIGSSGADAARGVAIDRRGNIYIAGYVTEALGGQPLLGKADAFVQKYSSSGSNLWTRQFGTNVDDFAYGMTIDSGNNIYVAGYTSDTLAGQKSSGNAYGFLRKYDDGGGELWSRQVGTNEDDYVYAVAVDKQHRVYVVGSTAGTFPEQTSSGFLDVFVQKYDDDGTALWTRQFGSQGHDYGLSIAIDHSNNVFIGGWAEGALPGQASLAAPSAFVRKYDNTGIELWTIQFGTGAGDYICGIAADSLNNVCIAGYTFSTLPGQKSAGRYDIFIRKYDSCGKELWTHQFGTYENDMALGIAVDDRGNIYLAGNTYGVLLGQTGSGYLDAVIRKYDSNGNELWTRQFGTRLNDETYALAMGSNDSIYAVGSSKVGLSTLGQLPVISEGAFLIKLNAAMSQDSKADTGIWSLGIPVIVILAIAGLAVLFALVFGIFKLVKGLSG